MLDLAIIGSGPAALTAAIYAARAKLSVCIYERAKIGGALSEIAHIANFPGFDGAGADLVTKLRAQVEALGVKIAYGECTKLSDALYIDDEPIAAKAVLIATGSEPRPLAFTPAAPVSYCALCDAPLYQGKRVLVIGGGNSAVGESLMLAAHAAEVTVMTHSELKGEKSRIDELKSLSNVKIIENTEPTPENTSGYDGIFVYIGKRPATSFLSAEYLDEQGYVKTANNTHQIVGNLYAAGDVRAGSIKQAITAAADGAAAAIEIANFLQTEH